MITLDHWGEEYRWRNPVKDPRPGDLATCSACKGQIVYIGPYWDHMGENRPRHPAAPMEETQPVSPPPAPVDENGIRKRTPAEWASWLCNNVPAMRPVWGPEDEALIEWAITMAIKQSSLWTEVATLRMEVADLKRKYEQPT